MTVSKLQNRQYFATGSEMIKTKVPIQVLVYKFFLDIRCESFTKIGRGVVEKSSKQNCKDKEDMFSD